MGFRQEGAIVVALLPRVGAPLLVRLPLEPGLLFTRGLGGLALRRGERAPPVQLCNRLGGVGERPARAPAVVSGDERAGNVWQERRAKARSQRRDPRRLSCAARPPRRSKAHLGPLPPHTLAVPPPQVSELVP